MAGVVQTISTENLEQTSNYLNAMAGMIDMDKLEKKAAFVIENQTKRRISDEKQAPDGSAWAAWSPAYAKTRHGGHGLLENKGDLLKDIFSDSKSGGWVVGSSLVYAAIQQFGDEDGGADFGIPARPFLGLSADNEQELDAVLLAYLEGMYQ